MSDQLELGTCGAAARLPSLGWRTCTEPAGHRPPPDASAGSTDGWHRHTDTTYTVAWYADDLAVTSAEQAA